MGEGIWLPLPQSNLGHGASVRLVGPVSARAPRSWWRGEQWVTVAGPLVRCVECAPKTRKIPPFVSGYASCVHNLSYSGHLALNDGVWIAADGSGQLFEE